MAEIRIERKPRRKAGAIILAVVLLLVIAAVWYWQTQVRVISSAGMGSSAVDATVAFATPTLARSVA